MSGPLAAMPRPGPRPAGVNPCGSPLAAPACVLRVDPSDGAKGVFRDAPVVLSLSRPVEASSVSPETLRVREAGGATVPGRLELSPDGSVVIWTGTRLLEPGVEHVVVAEGLRDLRGWEVAPHESRFVPCDFALGDPLE